MSGLPSLFVSHGAPTFALRPGTAGAALAAVGARLPRPRAVLVLSPHWQTADLRVGTSAQPPTIHDFHGFEAALYELRYPASGHPGLAGRACGLLGAAGWAVQADEVRGLDHGAWVPLLHLFPGADVPVFQVSLPLALDAAAAWRLGQTLAPLRDEGVLVVGSGSLTHNLADFRHSRGADQPYVREFSAWVARAIAAGAHDDLLHALERAPAALRAHPTAEHFWPLLVAAAAGAAGGSAWRIDGGIEYGILAMDAFVFGTAAQVDAVRAAR